MKSLRNLPLSVKLRAIIVLTSALVLLLLTAAFILQQRAETRRSIEVELASLGRSVAEASLDELLFEDREGAEQELAKLAERRHVVAAWLVSEDRVFASYSRDSAGSGPPPRDLPDRPRWEEDYLVAAEPILSGDEHQAIGTVYLKSGLDELHQRMAVIRRIALGSLLLAILVSLLLSAVMQRLVSKPILSLATTAKQVSDEKDFSLRASKTSSDEVGQLIDSFNLMLSRIQRRDAELEAASEELRKSNEQLEEYSRSLEQRVEERTTELARRVAELQEAHRSLQEAQAQLVHAEKMSSLGQLTAGIAHEINNPINFISSGLPPLKRSLDKMTGMVGEACRDERFQHIEKRTAKLLTAIEEGARRTAEIVDNLRSFSRLGEAEVKAADLHQALDATLVLLHNQTKNRIEVVKDYGDIPQIECTIGQLNQVFMNLLANATQAIEGEGTITISTRLAGDDRVEISIRDTGSGMPEDIQRRIFDPFFTTKDVGQGTGLGLSISHGIVEEHGGSFEVESAPEQGTDFRIKLPIRQSSETRIRPENSGSAVARP